MKVNFEIGKEYRCVGLYGGEYIIKVVCRTNDKIFFVYDERTSDDRSMQSATIEVKTVTVYGKNLEELGTVEMECAVAWSYHSQYATSEDDVDHGYYNALDLDRLYTIEEFKTMQECDEIKNALLALGYTGNYIEIEKLDDIRARVIYSGHLILGIYDFIKHTFVD